jgi:integrase
MAKRKARKHPGVVIQAAKPDARIWFRVRYVDPDTGKTTRKTMDRALRTQAMREDYACRLSDQLARRRIKLESGAPRATGTAFADGIQRFFDAHPNLRPKTITVYRGATDKLITFARKHRIRTVDDLDRRKLMMFREQIVNQPKHHNAAGGGRGAKRTNGERRGAHSVNRELRAIGTCLRYVIDAGLFAKLSHDDVRRCVKPLKAATDRKEFLRPAPMRKLLTAALRHDAATFKATRAEHGGAALEGSTPKYPAIAPFVAFVGLSGCRFGEAIDLTWDRVDLGALDAGGKAVGEVYIDSSSKTAKARTIGLEVSPALRKLLAAQRVKTGGKGSVFGVTRDEANAAMMRLKAEYGAPDTAGWQMLRRTTATYLCNAPGIYGSASPFMESRQLGHSVIVAERFYAGLLRGIPIEAKTLEAAMQIKKEAAQVVESIGAPAGRLVAV